LHKKKATRVAMVEVSPLYHTSRVFITAPTVIMHHGHQQTLMLKPNMPPLLQSLTPTPPQQQQQQPHVLFILKQEVTPPPQLPTQPLPPVTTSAADLLPLDLSCKVRHDSSSSNSFFDVGLGPRTNSCSSNSSSIFSDEDKRRKRKDQNKAAAHHYRQRKKSFSGYIETEHDLLTKKNDELKTRKIKLETQVKNMRALLDDTAKKEAKKLELEKAAEEAEPRRRNMSAMAALAPPPPPPPPFAIRPRSMSDVTPLMLPQHPSEDVANAMGMMRDRKNTWPMSALGNAAAVAAVHGRERKKEQNKLASRRFRMRRRTEMSHSEVEGHRLEARNKRLREMCGEMESKIGMLKDIMYNKKQEEDGGKDGGGKDNNASDGTFKTTSSSTLTTTAHNIV
jgi:hypothetical protein